MIHWQMHHIKPRHMGGTDDPSNLIRVNTAMHAFLHKQLWEEYGDKRDYVAWQALSGQITHEQARIEAARISNSKPKSPEHRANIAAARRGQKMTKKHMEKLHAGRRRSKNSETHAAAIRATWTGRKHSEESKQRMREARKRLGKEKLSELGAIAGRASQAARKATKDGGND